jgi:nucleoside 2-deoxyribosyltransferase
LKIYLVHQISGLTEKQVTTYYDDLIKYCKHLGFDVLFPMDLRGNENPPTEKNPLSFNHTIFQTDKWFVKSADVVYASFIGCTRVSIGSMMELAWAVDNNKHVVVAMEKENPHRHAFVLEAASVVFETEKEAKTHLKTLIKGIEA